jgi:hypothetical protein
MQVDDCLESTKRLPIGCHANYAAQRIGVSCQDRIDYVIADYHPDELTESAPDEGHCNRAFGIRGMHPNGHSATSVRNGTAGQRPCTL